LFLVIARKDKITRTATEQIDDWYKGAGVT